MLDTNICRHLIKRRPPELQRRLEKIPMDRIAVSSIVVAELAYGVALSSKKKHNRQALEEFLGHVVPEEWPVEAAWEYGRTRAHLRRQGTPIGGMDLLIAAHALHRNSTLITYNAREFRRVPGLRIENWLGR